VIDEAVAFAVGVVVAVVVWSALRRAFAAPLFARRNVRGVEVPVGAGVIVALAAVAATLVTAAAGLAGHDGALGRPTAEQLLVLVAALAFALLGFVDDVAGAGDERGFRGHLGALAHGRLTTGGLKLVGGGVVALLIGVALAGDDVVGVLLTGALVALGANLGNLFDRAPGRTAKVALACGAVLAVTATVADAGDLLGVAGVVGGGAGLLLFDLREELMLGDAGANALGASLGLGVAVAHGRAVQVVVVVALVALNLASEVISFSRVIDRVAPLRALDRLGRRQ
jgi:UDP-N-acetylmuramyl pentapeptide phosphotransferase/UDP-N-acetylglucosamine-1-phosphate transferase